MDNLEISFEIYTLHNPSKEPFEVIYGNKLFRVIPPNGYVTLPKRPFGVLAEKHLIDRMLNLENIPTNDETARARWRPLIVVKEDADMTDAPLDSAEIMQRKLDRLNNTNQSAAIKQCGHCGTKTFNLEEHMQLNHDAATPQNPETEFAAFSQSPTPQAPQNHASSILKNAVEHKKEDAYVLPEEKVEEVEAPAPEPPKQEGLPTRDQLIAHARDVLKMNVEDPKTKDALQALTIEELAKELHYGI